MFCAVFLQQGGPALNKRYDEDKRSRNHNTMRGLAQLSQIGITIVVTVLVGVLLGRFLDNWLGTSPWLLLVFSLLGAGAAIRNLFDMTKKK